MAVFPGNLDKPAPERQTILDFTGATDDEVAVESAGQYANHLHLSLGHRKMIRWNKNLSFTTGIKEFILP